MPTAPGLADRRFGRKSNHMSEGAPKAALRARATVMQPQGPTRKKESQYVLSRMAAFGGFGKYVFFLAMSEGLRCVRRS